MTFSTAGSDWYDLDDAAQKVAPEAWELPPRGHTTIEAVSEEIAKIAATIRFCLSPSHQQIISVAAKPGTGPTCEAAAKRLLVAAVLGTTGGRVGTRAEVLALLARRCERRSQDPRTGAWLAWSHEPLTGRRATVALATLVRSGFLVADRTGAMRIQGFGYTGTPTAHRAYAALLRWRQKARTRERVRRLRLKTSGWSVPTVIWHPEPELNLDGGLASPGRVSSVLPKNAVKRARPPVSSWCNGEGVNRRPAPVAPPAIPAESAMPSPCPAPEPVPAKSKVACPSRASGDLPVSDHAQPAAQLPAPPPPVADPPAPQPAPPPESKGDVAVAPEHPAMRVHRARDGRINPSHYLAQVAARRMADCARRVAEEEAKAARQPPAPVVTPRQGHTEGKGPDPRATAPARRAPSAAPDARPKAPPLGRPASTLDWARLRADHPVLEKVDAATVLASQVDFDLLRQGIDRLSQACKERHVSNPTAYLATVCRTLMSEAGRRRAP